MQMKWAEHWQTFMQWTVNSEETTLMKVVQCMEVPLKTVLSSVIMQQNQAVQLKDMLKIANL